MKIIDFEYHEKDYELIPGNGSAKIRVLVDGEILASSIIFPSAAPLCITRIKDELIRGIAQEITKKLTEQL